MIKNVPNNELLGNHVSRVLNILVLALMAESEV